MVIDGMRWLVGLSSIVMSLEKDEGLFFRTVSKMKRLQRNVAIGRLNFKRIRTENIDTCICEWLACGHIEKTRTADDCKTRMNTPLRQGLSNVR